MLDVHNSLLSPCNTPIWNQVKNLYSDDHEIASHTITHSNGKDLDEFEWAKEILGIANMLVQYAGVKPKDIKGFRASFSNFLCVRL